MTTIIRRILIVYLGGGLGASLRALLLWLLAPWSTEFPAPVLLVNLLGAFVLGLVFIMADEAGLLHAETRLFLAVGLLGGFTTFSTFGWGADLLLNHASGWGLGLLYVAGSVIGGIGAVRLGMAAGRELELVLARHGAQSTRTSDDARADLAAIEAEDRDESA